MKRNLQRFGTKISKKKKNNSDFFLNIKPSAFIIVVDVKLCFFDIPIRISRLFFLYVCVYVYMCVCVCVFVCLFVPLFRLISRSL